jgi:protocatechuate 3,4-dioxygenase beta subunit
VHLWHTDARGLYAPAGSDGCCYYDGTVRTDQSGRFRLHTIRPAQYPVVNAPPAHIHVEIRHPAGNLNTEIIFGTAPSTGPVTPSGDVVRVGLRKDGAGWRGEAVFVLSGTS